MSDYHPMVSYSLAVKARLGKKKLAKKGLFQRMHWWFGKQFARACFLIPENIIPVNLLSSKNIILRHTLMPPAYPSPFELTLAPAPVRSSGWKIAMRGILSFLLLVPFIAGFFPREAAAETVITPRFEKGTPSTQKAMLQQFRLLSPDKSFLEVSDCPLRINQILLAATDCVTTPHTFRIGGDVISHINLQTAHTNVEAWANQTEIHPYTDSAHGNANTHTNVDDGGYLRASISPGEIGA